VEAINLDEPLTVPLVLQAPTQGVMETRGRLLSEVLTEFLTYMEKEEGWTNQTMSQNKATYRMFMEHCGDRPIQSYSRRDLTSFYDLLRGLPALWAKDASWKGLSPQEIVESTKDAVVERMAMKTVKRHFSAMGRLFAYLKRRGEYEGDNPAYGFEFPSKGRAKDKRKMWEGEKLRALFASPVWTGCASKSQRWKPGSKIIKDAKYWLPILALYHGNRLEEFAQLRRSDVREEDGIWYFDINDEGDRQVKNAQSVRPVPIHPKVQAIGFLDYVRDIAPGPDDCIFPDLKPGGADGKLGHGFTKWWSEYRKKIGLYEKGLDYHSFRHGVTTKLYAADVSQAIIDELTGHEGLGTSQVVYKKAMPLALLYEAISKVEWPEVQF
jgi:integrase